MKSLFKALCLAALFGLAPPILAGPGAYNFGSPARIFQMGGLGVGNGGGVQTVRGGFINGVFDSRNEMIRFTEGALQDMESGVDNSLMLAMQKNNCGEYVIGKTEIAKFHYVNNDVVDPKQRIYSYTNITLRKCQNRFHFGDRRPGQYLNIVIPH